MMQINGEINNDYLKTDDLAASATHWSPCGTSGEIIVTIEITLDAQEPTGDSVLTASPLLYSSNFHNGELIG